MFLIDAGNWDIWDCENIECGYQEDPEPEEH